MTNHGTRRHPNKGMTAAELAALPVTVDLKTACRAYKIGRTMGYGLASKGEFPCPVQKVGGVYRVNRADLLHALGIKEGQPA